jgi:hypothetical protein
MASSKYYAYYIRGRQLALIEYDANTGDGLNYVGVDKAVGTSLDDIGPGGGLLWGSPKETIADGLEIEYAYSPRYTLESTGTEGTDFYRFLGWGSNGQNLVLFTFSGASTVVDLSSIFAADDYIVISGSGRWNGLHQVQSTASDQGYVVLKTRCNLKPSFIQVTGTFEADDKTFIGDSSAHIVDIETFKDVINSTRTAPYVFIDNAAHGSNHGLFSLTADTTSGRLTFNKKISIDADGDYTSTSAATVDGGNDEITIYNTFSEQISVYEGVNVLNDEFDTIDLPEYLAKALVYYVKAKVAEDRGEIEQKEYFMREFRRILEKHESSKIWGARMIGPGPSAIR